MNRQVKNKVDMYQTVKLACEQYQSVWNNIAGFNTRFGLFTAKLDELLDSAFKQSLITKGITRSKQEARIKVVNEATKLMNALIALASSVNDLVLLEEIKFAESELKYGAFLSTEQKANRILLKAQELETELADYGVDAQDFAALSAAIADLNELLTGPRMARADKRFYTKRIAVLVRELDAILKFGLDKVVRILKEDSPEFFAKYASARQIIDRRGRSPGETPEDPLTDAL